MNVIGLEESPCDQHCTPSASADSHGESRKDHTLVNVSSSSCTDAHGPTRAVTASWLSVAVTCELSVIVQTRAAPDKSSKDDLSPRLAACHGVTGSKSAPHFTRVSCVNMQELCERHHGVLSPPFTAERVLAKDVSTRSNIAYSLPERSGWARDRASSPGGTQSWASVRTTRCCSAAPIASKREHGASVKGNTQSNQGNANPSSPPSSPLPRQVMESVAQVVAAARELPTIALLLRTPLNSGRVLLVLRPAVQCLHHKGVLEYRVSLWPVSESVQCVAVRPNGDGIFALCDRFAQMPLSRAGTTSTTDEEVQGGTHLVLRGSYVHTAEGQATSPMLQPVLLHVSLRGSSPVERATPRSLLRAVVSGVLCRCALRQDPHTTAHIKAHASVTELSLYTTAGHVLVFQPVLLRGAAQKVNAPDDESRALLIPGTGVRAPADQQRQEVMFYTCCYGTRLSYSLLTGLTSHMASAMRTTCPTPSSTGLCVASPWRFVDQWRHSVWFRRALEGGDNYAAADAADAGRLHRRRRRHHPPSTVLATSTNRRVWLIRAGAHLSLVTVPSTMLKEDAVTDAAPQSCSAAVVKLDRRYILHDAQFVQSGSHGGFLLLCRSRGSTASGDGDDEDAGGDMIFSGASTHAATRERYVHCTSAGQLCVFFLSLLAMNASGADDARAPGSLFPLPLQLPPRLTSKCSSLVSPSHRLRFVCAATAVAGDDAPAGALSAPSLGLYVAFASSARPREVWTAVAHVPSLSAWCPAHVEHNLRAVSDGDGCVEGLARRVQQCMTHAVSAALPFTVLTQGAQSVDAAMAVSHALFSPPTTASSAAAAATSGFFPSPATNSLEASVEVALLHLDGPQCSSICHLSDALSSMKDVLYFTLQSFLGVALAEHDDADVAIAGEGVACVTAVFAGFCAAVRMSGLLARADHVETEARDGTDGTGPLPPLRATTSVLLLSLHCSAQQLQHALEDLCAMGHVSALIACASHLMQTVQFPSSSGMHDSGVSSEIFKCTPDAVWALLMRPLFDLVWGVVQDYGLPADVTSDVLLYCSPAVRAMAKSGPSWWKVNDKQPVNPLTVTPGSVALRAGEEKAEVDANHRGAAAALTVTPPPPAAEAVRSRSPAAAPTAASPAATTYTSAELYEVVRRVFLLHGATAALQLVHQLRQQDSTREAMAEMAQMYEAMQQRLDQIRA